MSRNDFPDRRMPVTIFTIPLPLAATSWRRYFLRGIIILGYFSCGLPRIYDRKDTNLFFNLINFVRLFDKPHHFAGLQG